MSEYQVKKIRKCLDCNLIISDKRLKTYRGNRANRCLDCKSIYVKRYHSKYWKNNKDRYRHRWIERLGNPKDDKRFLAYKHKLDNAPDVKTRKKIISGYKPLPDYRFPVLNQADYYAYNEKAKQIKLDWGEEYTDQYDW